MSSGCLQPISFTDDISREPQPAVYATLPISHKSRPDGSTYVELRYPDGKLPITRVIVGPLVSAEDEANVRSALEKQGYLIPLTRSDAPFQ
jgi:hypothetical protein